MTNTMIILATILIVTTINTIFNLYDLWSLEKQRVKAGYPAFSNFDYYYQIIPYLSGSIFVIILMLLNNYLPKLTTIGQSLVACLVYNVLWFVVNLLAIFILSIIQARLVRRG